MTNNFRRFLIAAISLSVLSLAACGSATDSSSKQTSVVTSTAETTLSEKATTSEVTETEAKAEKTTVAEIKDSSSSDGGAADIQLLEASADNSDVSSGSATVTIGNKSIDLSGAYIIDGVDVELSGGTYT